MQTAAAWICALVSLHGKSSSSRKMNFQLHSTAVHLYCQNAYQTFMECYDDELRGMDLSSWGRGRSLGPRLNWCPQQSRFTVPFQFGFSATLYRSILWNFYRESSVNKSANEIAVLKYRLCCVFCVFARGALYGMSFFKIALSCHEFNRLLSAPPSS